MAASAASGRLTLSDPLIKELAQASCVHEKYYDALPKLQGEANWQEWSDALQHAALMAGTDAVLNGELRHPQSLEGKQCTTIEWNDNIKRTAIWRSRNESLLKAMRGAADIDFTDFGALNAHDTYVCLRSRYHTSDNQRAFDLFSENLFVGYELDDSPAKIANELHHAFNQYNHLVGDNVQQRLPGNFLKMAFLESLDSSYDGWRKALLRDRDVLALGQDSTMSFGELVDLVIIEQARLLGDQTNSITPVPPPPSQQVAKRNISQVDEVSLPDPHRPCSLPHHSSGRHTNQACKLQNPRLRQTSWKPSEADEAWLANDPDMQNPQANGTAQLALRSLCSLPHHRHMSHTDQICWTQNPQLRRTHWRPNEADQRYLAEHPEIEDPQLRDISLKHFDDVSDDGSENGSEDGSDDHPNEESEHDSENGSDNGSEGDVESGSENEDESEQETSAHDEDDTRVGKDVNDDDSEHLSEADGAWKRFAAARFAEVQAQIDLVAQVVGGCQNFGKKAHKDAPLVGDLSGQWVLYNKELVSGTADHYIIELWENTTDKQKKMHPTTRRYRGRLSIKPHGPSTTFHIPNLLPHSRVTGHPLRVEFRRSKDIYKGKLTFWGKGKMIVTIPASVLGDADRSGSCYEFAGVRSDLVVDLPTAETHESRDNEAGTTSHDQPTKRLQRKGRTKAAGEYDRVIRTNPSTSVVVKVENED